jgi:hypothetical protein
MLGTAVAQEERVPCKDSPKVVGECFKIHGRIEESNGIPLRLWVIGTHRVLAPDDVPPSVAELLDVGWKQGKPMSIRVFGDYEGCPLEKERAGWMRAVCVDNASHLFAVSWDGIPVKRP